MASLEGTYIARPSYLAEEIDSLALERLHHVFDGFPGVAISVDGRKATVKFDDPDECLFAFQRHDKIEIVPGEVEWRFRMKDAARETARVL